VRLAGTAYVATAACLTLASGMALAEEAGKQTDVGTTGASGHTLVLRVPKAEGVAFKGIANFDGAGMGSASFLYPAPNVGGLVVAVLTHGALSASAQQSQRDKLQEEADQVLAPYRPLLDAYEQRELLQRALERIPFTPKKLGEAADPRGDGELLVEAAPTFFMTPDQSAIVLENAIAFHSATHASAPSPILVRVVSPPRAQSDAALAHWSAQGGERLKQETSRLYAESVAIALRYGAAPESAGARQRTVRYPLGLVEKMERATVLEEDCRSVLIRTLRGALMSVPPKGTQPGNDDPCGEAAKPAG
jgi:hypothetical protein